MSQRLLVLALAILSVNLAHAQVFDKKPFQQRLLGKVLLNAPMTAQEIEAMEPACLQIGMGKAGKNGGWQYDDMSHDDYVATLRKPEFAMTLLPDGGFAQWFHHYCNGMLGKYRFVTGRKTPHDNLRTWRGEMQYCLRDANGKSWIYENRTRKELAEAQYQSKEYLNAIATAKEVLAVDASFVEVYSILADSYVALKQPDKALASVREGLRQAPNAKGLKRRYKELGGQMPYPEPYAKPVEAVVAPPVEATPAAGAPKEEAAPKKAVQQAIQDAVQAIQQPVAQPEALPNAAPPTKPANPYCRFCP
jgi:tetratricopeptide (TPR) repeat protein